MPRPGPRPYECVRRAWHSDRHRPMRGSIIQQIFRVVNESHNPATKKNKEWQEKLPIVVFKAEEIMYSKANAEEDYLNLETLWDRLNEAINTIIRREEGIETGDLLPPCVEAALNLGCIPIRASRSERHNLRRYLTSGVQEPHSIPPTTRDTIAEQSPQQISESNRHLTQNFIPTTARNFVSQHKSLPPEGMQSTAIKTSSSMNFGLVYPLYYGTQYQSESRPQPSVQLPEISSSSHVLLGVPVSTSISLPSEKGVLQNLFSPASDENSSDRIAQADLRDIQEESTAVDCDLSLRLGLLPNTHTHEHGKSFSFPH